MGKKRRSNLKTLDLHRMFHDEVERRVYNFIMKNSAELPVRIVTGKSDVMHRIVISVVEENKFGYHYERFSNHGCIIVTNSQWIRK